MMEKGRFAPSPSGRMHVGNLFSFLLAWLDARAAGGTILLRMEDLDPERTGEPYAGLIAEDLRWLGLDWDEGYGAGGDAAPYNQRERRGLYDDAFHALDAQGLVYPCWCSRAARLAASAPHPGEERDHPASCPCRSLTRTQREAKSLEKPPAWKVAVPLEPVTFHDLCQGAQTFTLGRDCGDFIIRRADGVYGYQLAVTVDDALMGVTRVVRGRDLLDSTPWQRFLMDRLGYAPPVYAHVPMLLASDGRRLSKREGDLDLGALRERYSAEALLGKLAVLAGISETSEPVSAGALVSSFSWKRVEKQDVLGAEDTLCGGL